MLIEIVFWTLLVGIGITAGWLWGWWQFSRNYVIIYGEEPSPQRRLGALDVLRYTVPCFLTMAGIYGLWSLCVRSLGLLLWQTIGGVVMLPICIIVTIAMCHLNIAAARCHWKLVNKLEISERESLLESKKLVYDAWEKRWFSPVNCMTTIRKEILQDLENCRWVAISIQGRVLVMERKAGPDGMPVNLRKQRAKLLLQLDEMAHQVEAIYDRLGFFQELLRLIDLGYCTAYSAGLCNLVKQADAAYDEIYDVVSTLGLNEPGAEEAIRSEAAAREAAEAQPAEDAEFEELDEEPDAEFDEFDGDLDPDSDPGFGAGLSAELDPDVEASADTDSGPSMGSEPAGEDGVRQPDGNEGEDDTAINDSDDNEDADAVQGDAAHDATPQDDVIHVTPHDDAAQSGDASAQTLVARGTTGGHPPMPIFAQAVATTGERKNPDRIPYDGNTKNLLRELRDRLDYV